MSVQLVAEEQEKNNDISNIGSQGQGQEESSQFFFNWKHK